MGGLRDQTLLCCIAIGEAGGHAKESKRLGNAGSERVGKENCYDSLTAGHV